MLRETDENVSPTILNNTILSHRDNTSSHNNKINYKLPQLENEFMKNRNKSKECDSNGMSLPNELILQIAFCIRDVDDLLMFMRVCHRFRTVLETYLFRKKWLEWNASLIFKIFRAYNLLKVSIPNLLVFSHHHNSNNEYSFKKENHGYQEHFVSFSDTANSSARNVNMIDTKMVDQHIELFFPFYRHRMLPDYGKSELPGQMNHLLSYLHLHKFSYYMLWHVLPHLIHNVILTFTKLAEIDEPVAHYKPKEPSPTPQLLPVIIHILNTYLSIKLPNRRRLKDFWTNADTALIYDQHYFWHFMSICFDDSIQSNLSNLGSNPHQRHGFYKAYVDAKRGLVEFLSEYIDSYL